jgi:hypothetical protein
MMLCVLNARFTNEIEKGGEIADRDKNVGDIYSPPLGPMSIIRYSLSRELKTFITIQVTEIMLEVPPSGR